MRQKEAGLTKRLVMFALEDPEPLLYHYEPIRRDGEIVGYLTSGMFGHTVGRALGMGYVSRDEGMTNAWIESGTYDIEIAGRTNRRPRLSDPLLRPKTRTHLELTPTSPVQIWLVIRGGDRLDPEESFPRNSERLGLAAP